MSALGWIIVLIVIAAALIALAAWFYERATNEVALVKTGIGGRRVIIDGGTLALPYFHEITRVNMQTIRMTVSRTGEAALITKDRLRVDVGADFYVSVTPQAETITRAAQTLGKRLFQPDQLRGLIDGMMIDALRSVAARMTMDELHENRAQFVREVREGLAEAMANYGLQLDSVSLTGLDQTPFSALDENNAFNAVGMRKLAEVIAKSKKERAEIESESDVSVRRAAMEAAKRKLEIDLEQRRAEIAQGQEIETLMAAQLAEVAQRKADSERTAAQARMEQDIQAADIAREQAIREAEIAQSRALEDAESDRQIQLSAKSQEESRAKAQADAARAEAVTAAEAVQTARAMAEAERRRALALIAAQEQAEAAAKRAEIAAASDKATAADKADARRAEAEATKAVELARVEAERARIEAENARSDAIIAMELEKARLEAMPRILAEMVRPAEKITGISVNHLSGVGGTRAEGSDRPASPVNATVDAIMDMAVQLPSLQKLGDQISANLAQVSGKKKSGD